MVLCTTIIVEMSARDRGPPEQLEIKCIVPQLKSGSVFCICLVANNCFGGFTHNRHNSPPDPMLLGIATWIAFATNYHFLLDLLQCFYS
eukprot:1547547-Amphidinium_carterae.1